ncbi:MAG: AbrB/MazE/SpoVT family DNA-binding domain-containing protein [Thermoanaerobaculia bacterium]
MSAAEKTTIDASGRLVIPKKLREAAGLEPRTPLEIELREGHLEIRAAPVEMRTEQRGKVAVAVPAEPVPPLTAEDVERVRQEVREERERRWS